MPVAIRGPRPRQPDPRKVDPLDRDMARVLTALQIANQGFGIALKFDQQDATQAQTELAELKAQQAEQQIAAAPSPEEAQAARDVAAQKAAADVRKAEAQAEKATAEAGQFKAQVAALKESPESVTDLGKPMTEGQLEAQAFLNTAVGASDRMKQLSPQVTPAMLTDAFAALEQVEDIQFVGDVVQVATKALGATTYNQLPEADKQYLLNAMEAGNVILRERTGAQANVAEVALEMRGIVPKQGDTAQVLQEKAGLLDRKLAELRTKTGKNKQPLSADPSLKFDYQLIKRAEAREDQESRINQMIKQRSGEPGFLEEALNFLERVTVPPEGRQRPTNIQESPTPRGRGLLPQNRKTLPRGKFG